MTADLPASVIDGVVAAIASLWDRLRALEITKGPLGRALLENRRALRCLYIAMAEEGDVERACIGSIIRRWWKVSEQGIEEIDSPELVDSEDPNGIDPTPVVKFFTDGCRIVVGERFGPSFVVRKKGAVSGGDRWIDQLEVVWSSVSVS